MLFRPEGEILLYQAVNHLRFLSSLEMTIIEDFLTNQLNFNGKNSKLPIKTEYITLIKKNISITNQS